MNTNNNFAVELSANDVRGFYKKGLMDRIINNYPWLTVAGIDAPYTTPGGKSITGVEYAGAGNVLTFGTAKQHDVNWVRRPDYVREKGYAPVYDIVKDWTTIVNRLDAFARDRKPAPAYRCNPCANCPFAKKDNSTSNYFYLSDGTKVTVFDNFIKIGYTIIPRTADVVYFQKLPTPVIEKIKLTLITVTKIA